MYKKKKNEYKKWKNTLKKVSRSFYISIKILPNEFRTPIAMAYLFARATDTIADTHLVSPKKRITSLQDINTFIKSKKTPTTKLNLTEIINKTENDGEKNLLKNIDLLKNNIYQLSQEQTNLILEVIEKITQGQLIDIKLTKTKNNSKKPTQNFILNDNQLDEYTYSVAGSVGEFWTKLGFLIYQNKFTKPQTLTTKKNQHTNLKTMTEMGKNFGKGLQLINIFRDLETDLSNGRSYLPFSPSIFSEIKTKKLSKKNLAIYSKYSYICEKYLQNGLHYSKKLNHYRIKIATRLPYLIAEKMIQNIKININNKTPLDNIKIKRSQMYKEMIKNFLNLTS